jgi:hypothetical protein
MAKCEICGNSKGKPKGPGGREICDTCLRDVINASGGNSSNSKKDN